MTIESTNNENDYIGAGATDTFSYTFKIFVETDLVVTERDDNDVESTLILNTDYTVTGVEDTDGGTIVLTAGNLTTGHALNIKRVRPVTQAIGIRNQGDFFPEIHENAWDHSIMVSQQQQTELGRSLKLPTSITGVSTELPVPEALKLLRWSSSGLALENITAADISSTVTAVDASLFLTGSTLGIVNPVRHSVAGGTVDAMTATTTPAPASLTNNLRVYLEALGANATTTPTLNLDSLGAKTIVKEGDVALLAGDIPAANARIDLIFDSSLDKWILMNPVYATRAEVQDGSLIYAADTGVADAYVMTLAPVPVAYVVGMAVVTKITNANATTTPTLNVNSLGADTIKRIGGAALNAGDLPLNHWAVFRHDGTDWILQNPALHTHVGANQGGSLIGRSVQVVPHTDREVDTGTTAMPNDNSIPQNTEGDEFMSKAITPTNASNKLKIDVVINLAHTDITTVLTAGLFQDSTADALAGAQKAIADDANQMTQIIFTHYMTAGTTSPTTFKIRAGGANGTTTTFNGGAGTRKLGGVMASSIIITEIQEV